MSKQSAIVPRRRTSNVRPRYFAVLPALVGLVLAWFIARRAPPDSSRSSVAWTSHPPPVSGCHDPALTTLEPREKAAILVLLRAGDLDDLLPTLSNFEHRFNEQFRYPYVFLTDPDEGELPSSFRERVKQALPVGAETEWGVVPREHWEIPAWLDKDEVRRGFKEQEARGVQYAGREGYHHMCRWYSGLWARHPLLAKYEWYWRLEPGVRFHCSITYDPFRFLAQHNKLYGFVITVVDQLNTMPTLIPTTLDYLKLLSRGRAGTNETAVPPSPELWKFLMRKNGAGEYAACHFWTNFEIGNLDLFRSAEYQDYFRYLDQKGGFYTERWGDAPVRALALGLLAGLDKIHYFEDIAYQHDWFMHCPPASTTRSGPVSKLDKVVGCDCACPKAGELQGRRKGQELVDMDDDWRYSCVSFWKDAVRKARRREGGHVGAALAPQERGDHR